MILLLIAFQSATDKGFQGQIDYLCETGVFTQQEVFEDVKKNIDTWIDWNHPLKIMAIVKFKN